MIFEAFRQADGTSSRKYGGTGLGLSISRDLARLLGGGIEVDQHAGPGQHVHRAAAAGIQAPRRSTRGDGAARPAPRPRHAPPPAAAPAPPVPACAGRAPAFADDRDGSGSRRAARCWWWRTTTRFASILFDLAHELGYRCLVAQDAREGVELAGQQLPDAVLLDMRLPDDRRPGVLES